MSKFNFTAMSERCRNFLTDWHGREYHRPLGPRPKYLALYERVSAVLQGEPDETPETIYVALVAAIEAGSTATTEPPTKAKPKGKGGRPSKDEKDSATKVLAALCEHHKYDNGIAGNQEPVKVNAFARKTGMTNATISRFFKEKFSGRGHKGYVAVCNQGRIGARLALWQGEVPSFLAELPDDV